MVEIVLTAHCSLMWCFSSIPENQKTLGGVCHYVGSLSDVRSVGRCRKSYGKLNNHNVDELHRADWEKLKEDEQR